MPTENDLRAYINPQPAMSEGAQKAILEKFEVAETYTEDRRGDKRENWIASLRDYSTAVVPELFIIAKPTGWQDRRYADLLSIKDEIHGRGSFILEASSGFRSNDRAQWLKMRDRAYAMLNGAVRKRKSGRPKRSFTDRELEVMQAIMQSRHYTNWDQRRAAMEARGIKPPSRAWCIDKLSRLTANLERLVEVVPADTKFKRAPSKKALQGYIYFVLDGEFVKIGHSTKVMERVRGLATANPRDLALLGSIPGSLQEERALHKRFAQYHEKLEWFRYCEEIDKFIKRSKSKRD